MNQPNIGGGDVWLVSATAAPAAEFSTGQALAALLAAESFLLATVSLTVTLATPGRRRPARLPLGAFPFAMTAAIVVAVAAVGAGTAWAVIFGGETFRPLPEVIIATCLLVAILAQPLLALGLALALRSDRDDD
ncbi:hypothetical protein [Kineococcus rubinsiae]|uniref:hypothetical protein n=1 Tax=Kineococcus rubinsiae TaxID=2609562 RepID=UPI00142FD47F|nr:hypothetical protein [Kineococcus rubinsiae]NIZ91563.1 hypothetical protein [Kineococcus rubinsiae]